MKVSRLRQTLRSSILTTGKWAYYRGVHQKVFGFREVSYRLAHSPDHHKLRDLLSEHYGMLLLVMAFEI